jgi:predicted MFS family arabinose efflux permease
MIILAQAMQYCREISLKYSQRGGTALPKTIFRSQVGVPEKITPADPPDNDDYLVSKGYAWYVFFLLFGLMFFDLVDRQVISALFPYLKQEWGISDAQCGMLMATVNWSITVFALPVALLADRWSRKKTVGLMSSFWSLATLACAFTTSFGQMLFARSMVGAGEAGYVPAGNALIAVLFPQRLRSRLVGLFMSAGTFGAAVGVTLGGWIAFHYGWRYAFGIVALPGFILAALFFFIRDYKTIELTIHAQQEAESQASVRKMTRTEILKALLGTPSVVAIYCGSIMYTFFGGALIAFLPTFFIRVHGLDVATAATKTGMVLILSILGNVGGGWIADKLASRGVINGRPIAAALLQLLTFLMFMAAFSGIVQGGSIMQFTFLLLGGFLFGAYLGPIYPALVSLVHAGLRSTAVSVMTLLQNVFGFAAGAIVCGVLSDKFGIAMSLFLCNFGTALSAVFFLISSAFYKRDVAKVEKVTVEMEA